MTAEEIDTVFKESSERYRHVKGLIRKYYIRTEDNTRGGGIYLFDTQESADRLYDAAWRKSFVERYREEPNIRFFKCPIVVDNKVGEIVIES
ncbi:YdhR family protein [Mycobacterium sp. SM1]|nr:YdhR family protein [Mycobacterium sp. SM1]